MRSSALPITAHRTASASEQGVRAVAAIQFEWVSRPDHQRQLPGVATTGRPGHQGSAPLLAPAATALANKRSPPPERFKRPLQRQGLRRSRPGGKRAQQVWNRSFLHQAAEAQRQQQVKNQADPPAAQQAQGLIAQVRAQTSSSRRGAQQSRLAACGIKLKQQGALLRPSFG